MRRRTTNRANAFLLEIVINILLFAVLLSISLRLIMNAHTLTRQTKEIYLATEVCESIASIYECGDGTLNSIEEYYTDSQVSGGMLTLKLDSDFNSTREDARYVVTAASVDASTLSFTGSACDITVTDENGVALFSIRACHFVPAHGGQEVVE